MDARLKTHVRERAQPMGVRVTGQQAGLEEQQARGPNSGSSAKPRQNVTSNYRLQLEKKKGAQKDRDRKQNMIRWEEK